MNEFKSTSTDVLQNYPRQYELFHHVLPETILDENGKETSTMDWMWSWIIDGKGVATPREFIHWLNEAKEKELGYARIGLGNTKQVFPLISEKALKRSRVKMSKDRIFKTLLAEHKDLSDNIPFDFQDWKESFSIEELAIQMGKEMDEVKGLVRVLLDIGFLGKRTEDSQTNYFVGRVYWASLGASNEG